MDAAAFCRQSRVVLVIGKGGVGKTTVTAGLARSAADAGLKASVLALDDSGGLRTLFGHEKAFEYQPTTISAPGAAGQINVRLLTADAALLEYLDAHGLGRISRRLVQVGALDVIATAVPGIRELLVLAKLRQLEETDGADLFILDAPATGHAYTFLTSSKGLVSAARGGPLRQQAEEVVALLSDPTRCQVLLVTIPEETPVNETIEAAYRLEDEIGVALGPVIVNACLPVVEHLEPAEIARTIVDARLDPNTSVVQHLTEAANFRAARQTLQREQLERLASTLPLQQIQLPFLLTTPIGPNEVGELATALTSGIAAL